MTDDPGALPSRITTADGETLQAVWSVGDVVDAVAVLTHPHPLYGGDLDNLVPATLARALPERGIATVRINFRGVGASSGVHGGGSVEVADVIGAIDAARASFPAVPVVGVGYSFGADVLLATADVRLAAVVGVAPPLAVVPLDRLRGARGSAPTLILSPAHDQFRTADDAASVVADWADTTAIEIPGADHFMAGATSFVVAEVTAFLDRFIRLG